MIVDAMMLPIHWLSSSVLSLPVIEGVSASRIQLPPGSWRTVLECLCSRFPHIAREVWVDRMLRGRVFDAHGGVICTTSHYQPGAEIYYYREVVDEPRIAAEERILHADEHLLVVDKPHFLPVTPSGGFVSETLLARMIRCSGNADLAPLHRLDRETAGLVLFSNKPETRAAYHALFRDRAIEKTYEALAAPLPERDFPCWQRSRIVRGEPFFRMCEAEGIDNSETRIDVIARGVSHWHYRLQPVTGRKHQLRVHMASLGAPIMNDACYPVLRDPKPGTADNALQLLAKSLRFVDPLSGSLRYFESTMRLLPLR